MSRCPSSTVRAPILPRCYHSRRTTADTNRAASSARLASDLAGSVRGTFGSLPGAVGRCSATGVMPSSRRAVPPPSTAPLRTAGCHPCCPCRRAPWTMRVGLWDMALAACGCVGCMHLHVHGHQRARSGTTSMTGSTPPGAKAVPHDQGMLQSLRNSRSEACTPDAVEVPLSLSYNPHTAHHSLGHWAPSLVISAGYIYTSPSSLSGVSARPSAWGHMNYEQVRPPSSSSPP